MKRLLTLLLAAALSVTALASCGGGDTAESSASHLSSETAAASESSEEPSAVSEASTSETAEDGFTLYYPSYMQESEGETLMLEEKPERIIALSNSALQILIRCDFEPLPSLNPPALSNTPTGFPTCRLFPPA